VRCHAERLSDDHRRAAFRAVRVVLDLARGHADSVGHTAGLETEFMLVAEIVYDKQARVLFNALRCFDEPGRSMKLPP
jgi:hypothetical protein